MNVKKFLVVGLLGLFMISMTAGLVSAETTVWEDIKETAAEIFSSTGGLSGASGTLTAQWLLFFLVVLIVYAISSAIPFLGNSKNHWTVKAGVSVVIGVLAVFFLSTEEVLTILQTYKTLGITLTVIVPFFIVAIVSKDLRKKSGLMSKFVWVLFLGTLLVRYATADGIGTFGKWAFWVVAGLSLVMVIWDRKIWFILARGKIRDARENVAEERLAVVTSELEVLAKDINEAPNDAVAEPLKQKYNRKVIRQNELGGNYKPWGSVL
jgi:hypothetical protein